MGNTREIPKTTKYVIGRWGRKWSGTKLHAVAISKSVDRITTYERLLCADERPIVVFEDTLATKDNVTCQKCLTFKCIK